jgi:hypothetical protein
LKAERHIDEVAEGWKLRSYLFLGLDAWICIFAIVAMQACYSVAPLFLSFAATQSETASALYSLGIFFVFNFAAYPLTYLSSFYEARWLVDARRKVSMILVGSHAGKVSLIGDAQAKNAYVALATGTGQSTVLAACQFLTSTVSSLAASAMTLVVVTLVSDPSLLVAYVVSFVWVVVVIRKTSTSREVAARKRLKALNQASALLGSSWGVAVLNQDPFMQAFGRRLQRRWYVARLAQEHATSKFQRISMTQAVGIWLPATGAILWSMAHASVAERIGLIVFVPRVVELLLDLSHVAMAALDVGYHRAQLAWLNSQLSPYAVDLIQVSQRTQPIALSVIDGDAELPISGIEDLLAKISTSGRIRLVGPNGSGKTSLLLTVKQRLGDKSLYLGPSARQAILGKGKCSQGEEQLAELMIGLRSAAARGVKVFLLDEWATALDVRTKAAVSAFIDEIAAKSFVIEVLHQ